MANFNVVHLIGRLTRDPELRTMKSGACVANFGLAVNSGSRKDKPAPPMFIDCEAWGKLATVITEHLAKGRQVLVAGRLRLQTWKDEDGRQHSKHSVVADRVQFLDAPKAAAAAAPAADAATDVAVEAELPGEDPGF